MATAQAPTISVIITLFNGERFLEEDGMLPSLLAQSITDFEIVLVDDGSTDNTLAICREKAAQDPRIRIITQENRGASASRNIGIRTAQGEYVWIVDHDDQLESNALELVLDSARKFKPDVIRCNYRTLTNKSDHVHRTVHASGIRFDRGYIRTEILPSMIGIDPDLGKQLHGHWSYVLRRENLIGNEIFYDESKRKEEDHRFAVDVLNAAHSLVIVQNPLYNYIKRQGSLISKYSPRFENIIDNFIHYEELFANEFDFTGQNKLAYNISFIQECAQYVLQHEKEVDDKRYEIEKILSHPKVLDWYSRLKPRDRVTEMIQKRVLAGSFSSAYRVVELSFLKTRVKSWLRPLIKH